MYRYGNGQISLSDFQQARGTLPQSCSGRQNLPNLRKSPLLLREGYPAVRPCSGKAQERRGTEQGSGLPGRMRAGRSRAQIQPGKAEMWNGSGDGEAGRYSCACGCSVHSAAESAKDSVRFFTISGLAARLFATARKTEGCSVDISIDAAASHDIVCDSVTGKARAVRSFSLFPERPGLVVAILRPNLLRVKYDRGKSKRQGRKIPALVFGTEAAAES